MWKVLVFIAWWFTFDLYLFWRKYTRKSCCKLKIKYFEKSNQIIKKDNKIKFKCPLLQKLKEEKNILVQNYSKLGMKKVCERCLDFWKVIVENDQKKNIF